MLAELHNVSKRYGHQWALNQLSMNVEEGETLLLTGHNGAGKTTLLRLLATVMRPTHGTIKILGQDSRRGFEEIRPHIGLLSHQNHLYNQLNAYENLELVAKLSGKSIEIIPELLEQVNLQQKSKKVVAQYSAGMKRRLAIARILVRQPKLILLDEPFGQLDPGGVEMMEHFITQWQKEATIIIATHDVARGKKLASRHLHLEKGQNTCP
jgi:heme exporter protein A